MAEKHVTVLDADKRHPDMKVWARANDAKVHKLLMKRVTTIPANNECADCTAKRPGWAALPHGVHICINCAQIHRRIGRHISQVKAINTGTYLWYRDEYDCMVAMGNANARRLYLSKGKVPKKPDRNDSVAKKEAYIRDVYEHQKFIDPCFSLKKPKGKRSPKKSPNQEPSEAPSPQIKLDMSKKLETPTNHTKAVRRTTPIFKQPTVYESSFSADEQQPATSQGPAKDQEVDFFALFDMKPKAEVTRNNKSNITQTEFDSILSLYKN